MPGPELYPLPAEILGVPPLSEVRAYPNRFSWTRLREIVQSGELGDLKRTPELQKRYAVWYQEIHDAYGSTENYLLSKRLPWRDVSNSSGYNTPSSVASSSSRTIFDDDGRPVRSLEEVSLPMSDYTDETDYLRWTAGQALDTDVYAVLPNDWPYDTPSDVQHVVVWSKRPIFHPALIANDPTKWEKINREGLAGLGEANGQEWSTEGGHQIARMVTDLWRPAEFDVLWFANPPRLQSVRNLSHFHVFAKARTSP